MCLLQPKQIRHINIMYDCEHQVFLILLAEQNFRRELIFIFSFAFSDVSSGKFRSSKIFYSTFSRYVMFFLFIFHVTKAHAIFHTILHQKFKLDVAYKKRMRIEKEPFFCA